MLFLLCRIGDEAHALPAERVVELLPLVALTPLRAAPPGVAGALRYRGAFLPVFDLARLALGRAAPPRIGTRIVIVEIAGEDGARDRVGLIAEGATCTFRCDPADFAPFAASPRGLVRQMDVDALLRGRVSRSLLDPASAAA